MAAMTTDDLNRLIIELQRIAGALECLCDHFGASQKPPPSSRKGRKPKETDR